MCNDNDGDGYDAISADCPTGDDCDDTDADAHPGQTNFYSSARNGGGYDYDCDAGEEMRYPTVYGGSFSVCNSRSDGSGRLDLGWQSNLAQCGNSGTFLYCSGDNLRSESRTQQCQ